MEFDQLFDFSNNVDANNHGSAEEVADLLIKELVSGDNSNNNGHNSDSNSSAEQHFRHHHHQGFQQQQQQQQSYFDHQFNKTCVEDLSGGYQVPLVVSSAEAMATSCGASQHSSSPVSSIRGEGSAIGIMSNPSSSPNWDTNRRQISTSTFSTPSPHRPTSVSSSPVSTLPESPPSSMSPTSSAGVEGCPVCIDGIMVKHLHYGGKACYSCRGFFRRAVQTKRYTSFKCKGEDLGVNDRCTIESKSRKSCKHCRFQRCLRTGMSINLVMNEEERRDRLRVTSRRKAATMFSEAFKMTNRRIKMDGGSLEGDENSLAPLSSSEDNIPGPGLMLPFSEGEKRHLLGLLSNLHNQNNSRCYEFFAKDMEHLQAFVDLATMGKPVGPTYMKFMARLNEVAVKTFCFSLTEMSSVTPFDRMTLIAKNFKLIISLQVGCFFSDGNFPVFFLETLNYGRRNRDTNPSIKEVYNRLQCLLSGYQSNNRFSRSMNVSKIQPGDHLQAEHEEIHQEVLAWLGNGRPEARSDDHLNILLSLLMLFDPESVDFLEDKSKVERIHSTFVRMLAHYLDSATGGDRDEADHRFRTGMAMVAKIKRMQRIQEERGRWFTPQKLLAPGQENNNNDK